RLETAIASGAALDRFRMMVEAQGGDARVLDDPGMLPRAPVIRNVLVPEDGVVPALPPRVLGEAVVAIGGGRRTATDAVDPAVGFSGLPMAGGRVVRGERVAVIHARSDTDADIAESAFRQAWNEGLRGDRVLPLLVERITGDGIEPYGELR
ncbi:MAG TPA: thymidine phosphorylase, partial [Gemmatimonadales bacterium]|nr:thymidine phosphorylase [Gemmatimonadales bacterium]